MTSAACNELTSKPGDDDNVVVSGGRVVVTLRGGHGSTVSVSFINDIRIRPELLNAAVASSNEGVARGDTLLLTQ